MLNVVDEFSRECLAIRVARKLKAADVIDVLSDLFILRGVPGHIRSDNGLEFIARSVQAWITGVGAKTAYIATDSPWENGYVESFNARLRDELLNGEIFYTLKEAQIVIESWRRHYNGVRPHNEGSGARERPASSSGGGPVSGGSGAGGRRLGKLVVPERRRQAVDSARERYGLSERHACRIVGRHRGIQRYVPTVSADEDALTRAIFVAG